MKPGDIVKATTGPHAGTHGIIDFIYYDHLHNGDSADIVYIKDEAGNAYWDKSINFEVVIGVPNEN